MPKVILLNGDPDHEISLNTQFLYQAHAQAHLNLNLNLNTSWGTTIDFKRQKKLSSEQKRGIYT